MSLRFPRTVQLLASSGLLLLTGCTSDLNRAISRQNQEKTDEFLAANPNLEARDHGGDTPLLNACEVGSWPLIKTLVERGADVNAIDETGNTPLHKLVNRQFLRPDAVSLLIARGAKVDVVNKRGYTPLQAACRRGASDAEANDGAEIITELLKAGADANRKTIYGELPLHIAARVGLPPKCIELLLAATKDPLALDDDGRNAFTEAIRHGRHDTALSLARLGVKPQELPPQPLMTMGLIDPNLPFQARVDEVGGDLARESGDLAAALQRYKSGASEFSASVAQYGRVVSGYTESLGKAKDERLAAWQTLVLLNVVGAAAGAATGVGFVVIPKNYSNQIDQIATELKMHRVDLDKLRVEKARVEGKLAELDFPPPPPAAAAANSPTHS